MNVTLPESVREWLETQARFEGRSVDEFVLQLVHHAQASAGDPEAIMREEIAHKYGDDAVPEMIEESRKRLEAALIKGLDSGPATPVNEEFWEERRRVLAERIATQKKAASE